MPGSAAGTSNFVARTRRTYEFPTDPLLVYIYNSFEGPLMQRVAREPRRERSSARAPATARHRQPDVCTPRHRGRRLPLAERPARRLRVLRASSPVPSQPGRSVSRLVPRGTWCRPRGACDARGARGDEDEHHERHLHECKGVEREHADRERRHTEAVNAHAEPAVSRGIASCVSTETADRTRRKSQAQPIVPTSPVSSRLPSHWLSRIWAFCSPNSTRRVA